MNVSHQNMWPDAADEIIGSDQAVALAYVTPARGVVVLPLTNTGIRDRAAGRVTPVTTSIGVWQKLARLRVNPHVAVAYHTRKHGFSDRPEYVLVQGRATVGPLQDRGWIERNRDAWERFSGPRTVGLWEPLLRVYHWRIPIELDVERVVVWPDLACAGEAAVHGAPLPADPAAQSAPKNGTAPRVDHERAASRAARLPNVLLGWVGGDGFPVVLPVRVAGTEPRGMVLDAPADALPEGGRRAGLLAHWFTRHTYGQEHRGHTGWLQPVSAGRAVYAPHTKSGYRLPGPRALFRTAAGTVTQSGLRSARRAGFVSR